MRKIRLPAALPPVLGVLGAACLVLAVGTAFGLELGAAGHRAFVAAALVLLALGGLALLKLEGCSGRVLLVMLLPLGAAMLVRVFCLDYASHDYRTFLAHWYEFFKSNGGFEAIAHSVGDYNVPYLYFMAAISYLEVPDLYLIKLFSVLFDVLLAWGGLRLTRVLRGEREGDAVPLIAFAVLLLLPTVVLNGAYWGQCDSLYSALTVLALEQVLRGRNKTSVALLAVAFSFKLQTIFLIPLWGVLWFAKRVKFQELLVFPLTYAVTIVPALLLGKPLLEILGVYFNQMGEYTYRLSLNAPSIFQLIPYNVEEAPANLAIVGILAAAAVVVLMLALGLGLRGRLERDTAIAMAAVLAIGVPFLLPYMHERYYFLADVICLCWACYRPRYLPVAVLVEGSSLLSYLVYLRLKFNFVFYLSGNSYVMVVEMAMMLLALVGALWATFALVSRGGSSRRLL